MGYLTLFSEPWASVYLDSRKIGTTPFAKAAVPAGEAALTLDLEDSGTLRRVTVLIAPNSVTRKRVTLEY